MSKKNIEKRIVTKKDIKAIFIDREKPDWFIKDGFKNCDLSKIKFGTKCVCSKKCTMKLGDDVNLENIDLQNAILPSPKQILKLQWEKLSDELTKYCMAYDASRHPNPKKFDRWARGGPCPYEKTKIKREINFLENRYLWDPKVKAPSTKKLAEMLILEKCINSEYHEQNNKKTISKTK